MSNPVTAAGMYAGYEDDALASSAETVAPGRVRRLGGVLPLDGRISWAPKVPGAFQPLNCYLIHDGDDAIMIDTGLHVHRRIIFEQLDGLIARDTPITAFLTRAEFQCVGNLGALSRERNLDKVVAGGSNPFESYDTGGKVTTVLRRIAFGSTEVTPFGTNDSIQPLAAKIRIMPTFWVYDSRSGTLFTSDTFGHTAIAGVGHPAIIRSGDDDPTTLESAKRFFLTKFHWLPKAETLVQRDWLAGLFERYDVEHIAPTFGCVLSGKPVVRRHYDMVMRTLADVDVSR